MVRNRGLHKRRHLTYWHRKVHESVSKKEWQYLPYGKERRKYLLAHLRVHGSLPVNSKWQLQTAYDEDMKYLLKRGIICLVKIGRWKSRQSYIVLKQEKR